MVCWLKEVSNENMKKIIYKNKYIPLELVNEVREYFDIINDSLSHSRGPRPNTKMKLGWMGCWDRNLHYEKLDNPIHKIVSKLKNDFGNFVIEESSIRYLSAPFIAHSDVKSTNSLQTARDNGYKEGLVFLIPLWWKDEHVPGTAFFNSPPNLNEPLYDEMADILPKYSDEFKEDARNFSVREIVKWQSPGDLIAWENFQWHSSCQFGNVEYSKDTWVKEFISIETWTTMENNK